MGNQGLCGLPLTKGCPGDETTGHGPDGPGGGNEIDERTQMELLTLGFYISLVIGFFTGFWGSLDLCENNGIQGKTAEENCAVQS